METKDIPELVELNRDYIKKEFGIDKISLFGSFARGTQKPDSDIDLVVQVHDDFKTFKNYLDSVKWFEEQLKHRVDFIYEESLNPIVRISAQDDMIVL
jgi:predicted nucleotidyltransferase